MRTLLRKLNFIPRVTPIMNSPFEKIRYFSRELNYTFSTHFPILQVSLTLPERFTDVVVRVYSKNRDTNFVTNVQELVIPGVY